MGSALRITEDLLIKYNIIAPGSAEGQKIHGFLLSRAKKLVGDKIDFEKTPVTFAMAESKEPNAFFTPAFDPDESDRMYRDKDRDEKRIINPLDTPLICVTKGLIDLVDNVDQLDYVLGHELTHMMFRGYGVSDNSKGEEILSDLHAVDLVYDAGGDPKEALKYEEKIDSYIKKKEQERERAYEENRGYAEEEGIDWHQIFDVHVTRSNGKSALEASLTRISHLIDERTPSEFDKYIFDVKYNDPIDASLKKYRYEDQNGIGKLRILIDCVEHLSSVAPAQTAQKNDQDESPLKKGFFTGKTIESKYQQKIVWLADDAAHQARRQINDESHELYSQNEENKKNGKAEVNPVLNTELDSLNVYLQDKAYKGIQQEGYPENNDSNYSNAAALLYTYFYNCLDQINQYRDDTPKTLPRIEIDIEGAKQKIRDAKSFKEFTDATGELGGFRNVLRDMRSTFRMHEGQKKLDNISFTRSRDNWDSTNNIYPGLEAGTPLPWNNLVQIAQTDDEAKEHIVKFLENNNVEDLRITQNADYIKIGRSSSLFGDGEYHHVPDGVWEPDQKIPKSELDYTLHKDEVLQAYDYIRDYFDREQGVFDQACEAISRLKREDFEAPETVTDKFNQNIAAYRMIDNFISLYKSLPVVKEEEQEGHNWRIVSHAITGSYLEEHPMPCVDSGRFTVSADLFTFDNPIFQEHFGADFSYQISDAKEVQRQKMFEAGFGALKVAIDIWPDAHANYQRLEKELKKYNDVWGSLDGSEKDQRRKEKEHLEVQKRFYGSKLGALGMLTEDLLVTTLSNENRLTPEQENILAEYVVRNEKGIFIPMLKKGHSYYYTSFCDHIDALLPQIEKVVSGSYERTDMMQIIADNIGYKSVDSKEGIRSFVKKHYGGDNHTSKYMSHLHMFDVMQYLEKNPDIDLHDLSQSLTHIAVSKPNRHPQPSEAAIAAYDNYNKLVTQSDLMHLISSAVDFKERYQGLSSEENIVLADTLIALRENLRKLPLSTKLLSEDNKEKVVNEYYGVLNTLNKKTENALKKAQYNILKQSDALARVVNLYHLHNPKGGSRSDYTRTKEKYLSQIINKKSLSNLSKDENFWPEDAHDHIKAFVFAKNLFLDDKEFENTILNNIFDKVQKIPAGKKKNECLFLLLDKDLRAPYPETRQRLFDIYTQDIVAKLGQDDGSEKYQARLAMYLKALSSGEKRDWDIGDYGFLSQHMSSADKYVLLRQVSDTIVSQEETSQMIKKSCQAQLTSKGLASSYLYGVGVDFFTEEMDQDPKTANKLLQFLNSKGEGKDCDVLSTYMTTVAKRKYRGKDYQDKLNKAWEAVKPANCKVLYENFWSAPLEARAVIIARMLKSAVAEQNGAIQDNQQSWERVFDVVMDNVVSPDDKSTKARYSHDAMHSYIKAKSYYERELTLSAMMVANRNLGGETGNIGKGLRLFAENDGPAAIKTGQTAGSQLGDQDEIGGELQQLKDKARMPARWTVYDWIKDENIPEKYWKDKHLGQIRAASYYATIELGDDEILRLLVPEAREKAKKGFRVLGNTIKDLKEKDAVSDLDFSELTSSVQQMITQASKMSDIETDHEIGAQQCADVKDICDGVKITSGAQTFDVKVMDWKVKGKNWIVMQRAQGPVFNELPETTPQEIAYKKDFAKGYITFQIGNILSGGKFDHDTHGANLCIDSETNTVGLFDTGAMALNDPTDAEQRLLGHVLYDVIKLTMSGEKSFTVFSRSISDKIDELHTQGTDTKYLVEVKKEVLALGDFFKGLDQSDVKEIMPSLEMLNDIAEPIRIGIFERMSKTEKSALKTLSAAAVFKQNNNRVVIDRSDTGKSESTNIVDVGIEPTVKDKAAWLNENFSRPDTDDKNLPNKPLNKQGFYPRQLIA